MRDHLCVEEREHNGYRVRVCYDEDPMSPREWDNLGMMVCWHRRYSLGDVNSKVLPSDPKDWKAPRGSIVLPLYLYDHSGISMRAGTPFACPWDSGQVGWIYATREKLAEALGVKQYRASRHRKQAEAMLKSEVETYDQYLTGQVFGYIIDRKETCDKGHTHYEEVDSCWGFYGGADETMEEALACVPDAPVCNGREAQADESDEAQAS